MKDQDAAEVAKALSHSLRISILRLIRERGKLSPTEFTRETDELLGNVSYHMRTLEQAGILRVVDTEKRRGALEHYYSLTGPRAGIALAVMDLLADA